MRFIPPLRGNTPGSRQAIRLTQAQGDAQRSPGGPVHNTAAAGHDTDSTNQPVWFIPTGAAQGERNEHRARGWLIVVGASVILWAAIAIAVVAVVSALN
jgi:hypothetical protein